MADTISRNQELNCHTPCQKAEIDMMTYNIIKSRAAILHSKGQAQICGHIQRFGLCWINIINSVPGSKNLDKFHTIPPDLNPFSHSDQSVRFAVAGQGHSPSLASHKWAQITVFSAHPAGNVSYDMPQQQLLSSPCWCSFNIQVPLTDMWSRVSWWTMLSETDPRKISCCARNGKWESK